MLSGCQKTQKTCLYYNDWACTCWVPSKNDVPRIAMHGLNLVSSL